jgi:phosphatidylserine decarboxylase
MSLVSPYGRTTCAIQVGSLWLLGAALSGGLAFAPGLAYLSALGVIPFAAGLFVLSFYRDPERIGPEDPALLLSPADGVVTDIGEVDEPHYLGGKAMRVGIFLSPLNVHVNRVPVAGTVEKVHHIPGKCLPATGTRCIEENEATVLGLRTKDGLRLGLRQVTGALARTIVCGVSEGATLARGERYGMIKLGSRTELLLPLDVEFECQVQIGQPVRGGKTVLGRIGARKSSEAVA